MGEAYAKAFPEWIDHVFTGEADLSFPALLEAIATGADTTTVPGVTSGGKQLAPATPITGLDDLPVPDYEDFFTTRSDSPAPAIGYWSARTWSLNRRGAAGGARRATALSAASTTREWPTG